MLTKNKIGVMQGRLLKKYKGQYQAHPVGYWGLEFSLAQSLGLDVIEFILDYDDVELNPLIYQGGVERLKKVIKRNGVGVVSICADYFMKYHLHSADKEIQKQSMAMLERLILSSSAIGVKNIVIPCVDSSSLKTQNDRDRFIEAIKTFEGKLYEVDINLCLETDLDPVNFSKLLEKISSSKVTVNYDTGNSASLGYDCNEELAAYGDKISDIHIKDRVRGGGSTLLGQGDVKFDVFFESLSKYKYDGPFIFQAYRDDEGLEVFKTQLEWIKPLLEKYIKHENIINHSR